MKYRSSAFAAVPYGSGRASMRALSCLYCFFCSSDPVTSSIHFGVISLASFAELFEPFCEEAPGPPELFEIFLSLSVEGVDLARRPLLRGDLLHVDEAALLDPDQQRVDGALGDVGEALLPQPCRDLVAVRGSAGQNRENDALQRALEHLRHLLAHGTPPQLLSITDYWYIVTLNSGDARRGNQRETKSVCREFHPAD